MKIWQVDSFANEPFKGNPAGVMILKESLSDNLMQNIAFEMNLSETAFVLLAEGKAPLIRFFTPMVEIELCGHATLAAAHIILSEIFPEKNKIEFETRWAGKLIIKKNNDKYTMTLPARPGIQVSIDSIPHFVLDAISSTKPIEAYQQTRDLMLVYENEETIYQVQPDFQALNKYDKWIIITSKSKQYDFISRFFCSGDGILEDPVTGSAHCTLGPYWAEKLVKNQLRAYQASQRGGELLVDVNEKSIDITASAITVLDGMLKI
ncbi:MAG: PhzF family phenazine biosynthesis protein [Gammaproteobacteria bacterium]|jgi:PhzF family phenazine biosynthesis protein|nr:PhzF family phenazine biosynthesis protein [Gammaproteobacteria bacterium]